MMVNLDCYNQSMSDELLSAQDAAALLGISKPTLYAYVSRGLLQSQAGPGPSRARLYPRRGVEALRARRGVSAPERGAASAMDWGSPVLESQLCLIEDGSLFYRGRDAMELAASSSIEDVATLLWNAPEPVRFATTRPHGRTTATTDPTARLIELFARPDRTTLAGPRAPHAPNCKHAATLVARAFGAMGAHGAEPAAHRLARALGTEQVDLISASLVACADHELNVSAFTARCIASAEAGLDESILGALCAFHGHRHGGAGVRLAQVIDDARAAGARQAVRRSLAELGEVPGFGHPLYPNGDPRAVLLLDMVAGWRDDTALDGLVDVCGDELDIAPNLDFALAVVGSRTNRPQTAGIAIFALGRTVGWIAHIFETWASGAFIRPRARYVGPRPDLQSTR